MGCKYEFKLQYAVCSMQYAVCILYLPVGNHTYGEVITALDGHFEPTVNHSYEIDLFRMMKQHSEETTQQFYIRLKEQSSK